MRSFRPFECDTHVHKQLALRVYKNNMIIKFGKRNVPPLLALLKARGIRRRRVITDAPPPVPCGLPNDNRSKSLTLVTALAFILSMLLEHLLGGQTSGKQSGFT